MRALVVAIPMVLAACGASPIEQAKEIAAHDLADPAAAQFRDMEEMEGDCIVGELNAKNRMGAYTGFRPFIVDLRKKSAAILPDRQGGDQLEVTLAETRMRVYAQDCGKREPAKS